MYGRCENWRVNFISVIDSILKARRTKCVLCCMREKYPICRRLSELERVNELIFPSTTAPIVGMKTSLTSLSWWVLAYLSNWRSAGNKCQREHYNVNGNRTAAYSKLSTGLMANRGLIFQTMFPAWKKVPAVRTLSSRVACNQNLPRATAAKHQRTCF